jgi:hypothetical protein
MGQTLPADSATNDQGPAAACACGSAAKFSIRQKSGPSGLFMKYLRRGSGYYIDVGASELIAEGKIRLKSGVSNRLNSMRSADCSCPRLRETEVQNFSLFDEIFNRTSHIFDRHLWIDSVLLIEINAVGFKALK